VAEGRESSRRRQWRSRQRRSRWWTSGPTSRTPASGPTLTPSSTAHRRPTCAPSFSPVHPRVCGVGAVCVCDVCGVCETDESSLAGTSERASRDAFKVTQGREGFLYSTAGVHPHDAKHCNDRTIANLRELVPAPTPPRARSHSPWTHCE
jgi:hypothetical protein